MNSSSTENIGAARNYLSTDSVTTTTYQFAPVSFDEHCLSTFRNIIQTSTVPTGEVPRYGRRVFLICVLCVGVVGTLANGSVLYILGRSRDYRKPVHILILNQLALDLFSSVFLEVVYLWKIINPRLNGTLNFVFCLLIKSEDILWIGLNGSTFNLVFMTWERYLKIVFPVFHGNYYRTWINYILIALAWVSSFLMNFLGVWTTTDFSDGHCAPYSVFSSQAKAIGVVVYIVALQEVIPVITFLLCYGHIIAVIRRSRNMLKTPEI